MNLALNEKIAYGGAILVIVLLLGKVGDLDMQDEIAEQDFYCEQVLAGHWPDYKHIADEVCDAS